jgi:hypothetical protein
MRQNSHLDLAIVGRYKQTSGSRRNDKRSEVYVDPADVVGFGYLLEVGFAATEASGSGLQRIKLCMKLKDVRNRRVSLEEILQSLRKGSDDLDEGTIVDQQRDYRVQVLDLLKDVIGRREVFTFARRSAAWGWDP